jgi:hypothetical protein
MIKVTSISGIMTFIMVVLEIILYFMFGSDLPIAQNETPPVWNVLLRTFLGGFTLVFQLIFFIGFQQIVRMIYKDDEWITTIILCSVCIYVGMIIVAKSLEAGVVFSSDEIAVEATEEGLLAKANILLYGSFGRLMTSVFMIAASIVTFRGKIFPKWTSIMALIIGIINIIFIPSMFFGIKADDFYSAIGWGNSAVAASLFSYWVLCVSIIMIKNEKSLKEQITNINILIEKQKN